MVSAVPRRIHAPMRNSGTIRHMPTRIVKASAIAPTSGRMRSPGITHSDEIENPVARARAGIASDNAASTPGAIVASAAEMAQFSATATTTLGARAKPRLITAVAIDTVARNFMTPGRLPARRRVAMRAP